MRRHDLLWKLKKRPRKAREREAVAPRASENTQKTQAWLCGSGLLTQPSFCWVSRNPVSLYKLNRTCFPKILFQIQYCFQQTYYIFLLKKKTPNNQGLFFTLSLWSPQFGWEHHSVLSSFQAVRTTTLYACCLSVKSDSLWPHGL